MKLISPYECQEAFFSIKPHSIITPFQGKLIHNLRAPARIITTPEFAEDYEKRGFEVHQLKRMHIKLAIGEEGALIGSWNFSLSNYGYAESPTSQIDLVIKVEKSEQLYSELKVCFDYYWNLGMSPTRITSDLQTTVLNKVAQLA